ncbi:MAG: AbrB/MazE/SpoVT family DNA-binding domain-containing protein [Gammaproteobacteria bacterium]|nr:AbrB/MazE/SpoVT family DNA-binding domain-containing protein [Gammaproteobacteria bacterium]MCY4282695.1 AbrB/MazE/SpoVT family DNA-binding domain-containing protein [Gammaproteobacteria bacterium]
MLNTIIVSARGQITLPAAVRKRFGLKGGGALILEERNAELVLKPAAVTEMEIYNDDRIAKWDEEDQLAETERKRIRKYLERQN